MEKSEKPSKTKKPILVKKASRQTTENKITTAITQVQNQPTLEQNTTTTPETELNNKPISNEPTNPSNGNVLTNTNKPKSNPPRYNPVRDLNEPNSAIPLLKKVSRKLGDEATRALVKQAQEIFSGEGMYTNKEDKKRTLGGIFFYLVKQQMTKQEWRLIAPRPKRPWPRKQKPDTTKPE